MVKKNPGNVGETFRGVVADGLGGVTIMGKQITYVNN